MCLAQSSTVGYPKLIIFGGMQMRQLGIDETLEAAIGAELAKGVSIREILSEPYPEGQTYDSVMINLLCFHGDGVEMLKRVNSENFQITDAISAFVFPWLFNWEEWKDNCDLYEGKPMFDTLLDLGIKMKDIVAHADIMLDCPSIEKVVTLFNIDAKNVGNAQPKCLERFRLFLTGNAEGKLETDVVLTRMLNGKNAEADYNILTSIGIDVLNGPTDPLYVALTNGADRRMINVVIKEMRHLNMTKSQWQNYILMCISEDAKLSMLKAMVAVHPSYFDYISPADTDKHRVRVDNYVFGSSKEARYTAVSLDYIKRYHAALLYNYISDARRIHPELMVDFAAVAYSHMNETVVIYPSADYVYAFTFSLLRIQNYAMTDDDDLNISEEGQQNVSEKGQQNISEEGQPDVEDAKQNISENGQPDVEDFKRNHGAKYIDLRQTLSGVIGYLSGECGEVFKNLDGADQCKVVGYILHDLKILLSSTYQPFWENAVVKREVRDLLAALLKMVINHVACKVDPLDQKLASIYGEIFLLRHYRTDRHPNFV